MIQHKIPQTSTDIVDILANNLQRFMPKGMAVPVHTGTDTLPTWLQRKLFLEDKLIIGQTYTYFADALAEPEQAVYMGTVDADWNLEPACDEDLETKYKFDYTIDILTIEVTLTYAQLFERILVLMPD